MEHHFNHCLNCFNNQCKNEVCPIVPCSFGCLSKLHKCKIEDHYNICPEKIVPCINKIYGCNMRMRNKFRGLHLEKCASSAISCNIKWCRCTDEKYKSIRVKFSARDIIQTICNADSLVLCGVINSKNIIPVYASKFLIESTFYLYSK